MKIGCIGLVVVIVGSAQLAVAGEPWGAAEEAVACEKEYVAHKDWRRGAWQQMGEALKRGEVSGPCKAEIEKRAAQCVNDPEKQKLIKDPAYKITDGAAWCQYQAFWHMCIQLDKLTEKKEQEAKEAKAAAERQAALEKVELPKGSLKNAALEKAVALAYQKDYEGKVLKVIIDG